jgi:hypothetical protein
MVVEGVATGRVLAEEMGGGELGQERTRRSDGEGGECGRRRSREIGTGVQGQQPEEAGGGRRQRAGGPGEHGGDVHGGVVAGEGVETAVGLTQFCREGGQGKPGMGARTRGHTGQGERQSAAQSGDLTDRLRLGRGPLRSDAPGQEVACLVVVERVQGEGVRPLRGHETGQPAAAGDDRQAAGTAGEQLSHLLGVPCVVQQDEEPPAGQHAPVQRDLRVHTERNAFRRHPQGGQETPYGLAGTRDRSRRVEAPEVDVELPVGEAVGHLMRPVHGQRGLADAGHSVDGGDHHCVRGDGTVGQRREDLVQFGAPTREHGQTGRQLRGPGKYGGRRAGGARGLRFGLGPLSRGSAARRGEAVPCSLAGGPQFRPWIDAEGVGQQGPCALVRLHRFRPKAAGRQEEDQPGQQRLVQRVVDGGPAELGQDRFGDAGRQSGVGGLLSGGGAFVRE